MNPKPRISNPMGIRFAAELSSENVETTNGAGGVKVGKRVGVTGAINAAANVGSIVGVEPGVGVAGAVKIGNAPALTTFTKGAYTQATELGTPG